MLRTHEGERMMHVAPSGLLAKATATHARRIALTAVPVGIAAALLVAGIAQGVVPVTFVVSGGQFQMSADAVEGTGFSQYAGVATDADGAGHAVTVANIQSVTIHGLCQSVVTDTPFGPIGLVMKSGQDGRPVTATNLQIGMTGLQGDASFDGFRIGVDAATVGTDAKGGAGDFAVDAQAVSITDLRQTAWSTQASVLRLNGMSLEVTGGDDGCF